MPAAAHAGAWTQPQGAGQVVTTGTASTATEAFGPDRELRSTPRYSKFEMQALMEYGVSDWLTVMAAPGFQSVHIASPVSARRTGLGYTELGARLRLTQGENWVLSGQGIVRVPGTFDAGNPAAVGYTGVEVDVRGLFGASFAAFGRPAFVDLQLAQRFRDGGPPNEARVDLTFGLRTARKWLLLAQSFNVISEGSGSALFLSYSYHKLQLSALYQLDTQWAVQAGLVSTFAGRNALQENGLVLGAWYRF
jgi:hypothetical protein